MIESFGINPDEYCLACFDGDYPHVDITKPEIARMVRL